MKQFFTRRWFFIALAVALSLGITMGAQPDLARVTSVKALRYAIVCVVLFLMALPLEASTVWQAIRRPGAPLLASVVNFGVAPLLAVVMSYGLSPEFAHGFLVVSATPCTLASASVWTRRAGGNDAVSIVVTVFTNLTCFVVTPLWMFTLTGAEASVDLAGMIVKLGMVVVCPMALAQIARLSAGVATWATARKSALSVAAQSGILMMIFIGSCQLSVKLNAAEQPPAPSEVVTMVVFTGLLHVALFGLGMGSAALLGMSRPDRIAVGISGSQKTLMVGLQVCLDLNLSILPMVTYHVGQLIIDTLIADRLKRAGPD
ncbi:MAG: bile acid:sodium symporter [Pirellulaceae bacterium]|nr:bile acid:sodium symporter [Pirellulaceae bacterium]MDP7015646.1 bile acid:sodium symporter [Pirellulaceae bacterium]